MAGGGARPGAGRPQGGISQARRLIIRGLQRGLAQAMISKGADAQIDEEELATAAVAHIASDMVLAGQGRDVLAIWAQAAPKNDDNDDEKKSPLVRALERLPGMVQGPARSQTDTEEGEGPGIPAVSHVGATYPQSVVPTGQPFFTPQRQLLPADLEPLDGSARDVSRGPDARTPAAGPGHPPPPGSPPSPLYTPVVSENFEKKSAGTVTK